MLRPFRMLSFPTPGWRFGQRGMVGAFLPPAFLRAAFLQAAFLLAVFLPATPGVGSAYALGSAYAQPTPSSSPRYVDSRWTATDGLPSNSVRDLVQGAEGYLWVGAERGLRRFDGATFERLPSAKMTDTLTAGGRVEQVQPCGEGVLVRYRNGGLALVTAAQARLLTDEATAHAIGPEGAIWVGTGEGVSVYRNGSRSRPAPTALQAEVRGLLRTRDSTLWVATRSQGLYRRLPNGEVRPVPGFEEFTSERVALVEGPDGTVYVGTEAGLWRWTEGRLSKIPAPSSETPLHVIEVRPNVAGTCWARAPSGVYRCQEGRLVPYSAVSSPAVSSPERRPRSHFVSNDFVFESAGGDLYVNTGTVLYRNGRALFRADRFIRSVLLGRQGNLWIGTDGGGLVRLRPTPFTAYGEPEGLPENAVATILDRRDGGVWIGGEQGGLTLLQGDTKTVHRLRKAGAPMRHVWTLHEDPGGQLWVGGTRLCRFVDGGAGGGGCARPDAEGPTPSTVITAIQNGPQGRLWVGTLRHGLFRRDSAAAGLDGWTHLTPETSALPGRRVRTIHTSPGGALWISVSGKGLVRWRGQEVGMLGPSVLSARQPTYVRQDTAGILWVGTLSSGLRRVDLRGRASLKDASVTAYRSEDGLFHNTIYQILADDQGRLWMNTPEGLFWVRRADLNAFAAGQADRIQSVSYSTRDGLRNVEGNSFGTPGATRAREGQLWFPTMGGAVTVDPADVPVAPSPPPVNIAEVRSNDRTVAAPDSALSLASTERTFRIDYAGLRLRDPTDLTYRYRLVGFQNDWTRAQTRREAFFTKVPPGQYTFEVAARTHLGPWSREPARLTVSVAPYFYETWWFYGLCAVALGLVGYVGLRYRLHALERRQMLLKEKVAERTRELRRTSAQLEALFERSPDMIKIHDAEGTVLRANPRYFEEMGYREKELIGMKVWELDPSISPQEAAKLWGEMEIGDRHRFESILRRKDGSTFPVEVHIRRLRLGGDDRFMAITRDITERKEAERELERENERLDRFASVLSHDLRNPLNVAQGRLQLAQEAGGGDPSGHLSSAQEALGRMDEIIQDVLLLTWSEQEIDPEDVETAQLEEEARRAWENVEAPQAAFEVAAPARLKCHEGRLRRLLENLFRNAVEHGGEAAAITTGPLPRGNLLEDNSSEEKSEEGFFVEDDGPGIPEEKREKVLEGGYSSREEGTGLGLSIVQGIAQAHGWSLSVTEGREGGARFEISDVEVQDTEVQDTEVQSAKNQSAEDQSAEDQSAEG